MNGCRASKKRRFRDHEEAVRFLHRQQNARQSGCESSRAVRAYECDHCKGWHVTSQAVSSWSLIDPVQLMVPPSNRRVPQLLATAHK